MQTQALERLRDLKDGPLHLDTFADLKRLVQETVLRRRTRICLGTDYSVFATLGLGNRRLLYIQAVEGINVPQVDQILGKSLDGASRSDMTIVANVIRACARSGPMTVVSVEKAEDLDDLMAAGVAWSSIFGGFA